jgi:hypothetical protein
MSSGGGDNIEARTNRDLEKMIKEVSWRVVSRRCLKWCLEGGFLFDADAILVLILGYDWDRRMRGRCGSMSRYVLYLWSDPLGY